MIKSYEIDRFIEVVRDGKWHSLDEIMSKIDAEEINVKLITSFLEEISFVQLDKERKRIKLDTLFQKLLDRLDEVESSSHYEEITA